MRKKYFRRACRRRETLESLVAVGYPGRLERERPDRFRGNRARGGLCRLRRPARRRAPAGLLRLGAARLAVLAQRGRQSLDAGVALRAGRRAGFNGDVLRLRPRIRAGMG